MSVKNAARILIGRFGVVWGIMIYMFCCAIVLLSLSMVFVLPIVRELREAGLFDRINELFDLMLKSTLNLQTVGDKFKEVWETLKSVYLDNSGVQVNFILLVTLVFVVLNKLLLGYYELPVLEVLHDKMSYNAKTGLVGRFISNLKRSSVFVLYKLAYSVLFDAVTVAAIFGLFCLWGVNPVLTVFLPLLVVLVFILLQALRCALAACWATGVVVDGQKPWTALKNSVKMFPRFFSRSFGAFVIIWMLIFVINILFGLLTFGAALILTVPASIGLICAANMTVYYANTGRRYYITDENIQKTRPSIEMDETDIPPEKTE